MDINETEITRLIMRAKSIREKIKSGPVPADQLCELYGIYTILIRFHLLARPAGNCSPLNSSI